MKDKENGSWKDLKEAYRIYVKLRDGFVKNIRRFFCSESLFRA
ncbi:hypothetical protein [Burkholderia stagnalis]|nr:hypothetical protein [Burkholderia stagnalis]